MRKIKEKTKKYLGRIGKAGLVIEAAEKVAQKNSELENNFSNLLFFSVLNNNNLI